MVDVIVGLWDDKKTYLKDVLDWVRLVGSVVFSVLEACIKGLVIKHVVFLVVKEQDISIKPLDKDV